MEHKICIKSMHPAALAAAMEQLGQPPYRAQQIFRWLSLGVSSFEEMTNISKDLRRELDQRFFITKPGIAACQKSKHDGTVKYLFSLEDGNCIETVLMKYEHGYSICLSTQAGCKMGCVFCASYEKGATRNLTPAEIYDQVLWAQKDQNVRVSNIVLMGTGEPLDNYENVVTFLRIVSHPQGLNIGMRHISLSTCGLVPKIEELGRLKLQLTLSVSLHAPTNAIRDRLMPVNRSYPLEKLIPACRRYFEQTGRRISFEYAMIRHVNDTPQCAAALAQLLSGMHSHVNLIPLNHVEGSPLEPSTREDLRAFQNALIKKGITTTVRRSLGGDIDASCGQLRKKAAARKENAE